MRGKEVVVTGNRPNWFLRCVATVASAFLSFVEASAADRPADRIAQSPDIARATSGMLIGPKVKGERRVWHPLTLDVLGPESDEDGAVNPFADYRMDVTFSNGDAHYKVPGYFAACGMAADNGCSKGRIWRAAFTPDRVGRWSYVVRFAQGTDAALTDGGTPVATIDGQMGSFDVLPSDKTGRDFRARGRLDPVGEHYFKFRGDGRYFFKVGVDAPESTLAYRDFDATPETRCGLAGIHDWAPHKGDFDPRARVYAWGPQRERGHAMLGMVRYLATSGVNAFSFLTFSVGGDTCNVFPHKMAISATDYVALPTAAGQRARQWNEGIIKDRFDVSKLDQWGRVFAYADTQGLFLHFKLTEIENFALMDGGKLGRERSLYLRELIARFGHHLALNWNIGEENRHAVDDLIAVSRHIRDLDAYGHPIVLHSVPQEKWRYAPLIGRGLIDSLSIQGQGADFHDVSPDILEWRSQSAGGGERWAVSIDESGGADNGVALDAAWATKNIAPGTLIKPDNRADVRRKLIWGAMLSGGAGAEFYYGYRTGCTDMECEDHRSRATKLADGAAAIQFFDAHLETLAPYLRPIHGLLPEAGHFGAADALRVTPTRYVIYVPEGTKPARLNIEHYPGRYVIGWYDPVRGGSLQPGSLPDVAGGDVRELGTPPFTGDAVVVVTKQAMISNAPEGEWRKAQPEAQRVERFGLERARAVVREGSGKDGDRQMVVIRNGELIYSGPDAERRHDVYSIAKSITATLAGLVIDGPKIGLDDRMSTHAPFLASRYADARWRDFLSMTSGYNADGVNRWSEPSADWSRTPLNAAEPFAKPGFGFAYWDEGYIALANALTAASGADLRDILRDQVFQPIGVTSWTWWAEGKVKDKDAVIGATGLTINALDLARLGHMILRKGNWNGRQIIPAKWVEQISSVQVDARKPLLETDRQDLDGRGIYGFGWWVNGRRASGTLAMPHAPVGTVFASGFNNNVMFIIPEWDMVIVRLGEDGNPKGGLSAKLKLYDQMFAMLAPALMSANNSGPLKVKGRD
jgi:CubicO group peptidase (beta-lactamase class C family)